MRLINADKIIFHEIDEIGGEYEPYLGCSKSQIDSLSTVEAIPKADYETRLKATWLAMLEDLKKEMNHIKECEYQIYGKEHWNFVGKCQDVIQQKINELNVESEEYEMTDYKKYIDALRRCAKEHESDKTFTGHIIVSDLCRDTANLLETLDQEPTYYPMFRNQQEKHRVFHTVTAVEKFFTVIGNDDAIDDISILKELVRRIEVKDDNN